MVPSDQLRDDARGDARSPRADAQRNRLRVFAAARIVVASRGLNATYDQIAREAGVGVGTAYRHYPDRNELLHELLLEELNSLIGVAEHALEQSNSWQGFTEFFVEFARRATEHAGLSDSLQNSSEDLDYAKASLRSLVEQLTQRAQADGHMRPDARWQDILFLAHGAAAAAGCLLHESAPDDQLDRNLDVIVKGLHA